MFLTDGQALVFLQYMLCGVSIGIIYTCALILRLLFGTKLIGKLIDFGFGVAVCLNVIIYAEIINNFTVRAYCVVAVILGYVLYYFTVLKFLNGALKIIDKKFQAAKEKRLLEKKEN